VRLRVVRPRVPLSLPAVSLSRSLSGMCMSLLTQAPAVDGASSVLDDRDLQDVR